MKKTLLVALCVIVGAMGLVLAGCGAKYADSPYVGTWNATTAEYQGMELSVEEIYGNFSIALNEDGTCDVTVKDSTESGNWEPTDKGIAIKDSSDSLEFTDVDGKLTIEYTGVTISFEKAK